jgi:hypothetical protein
MNNSMITPENWNHCHYTSNNLKAIISLGASPEILDNTFFYFVSVLDEHNNELLQDEFLSSDAACQFINRKYSTIWNLNDMSVDNKSSDSGCSTCVAH